MSTVKVAISMDQNILEKLDQMVKNRVFPNRSRAIQKAVEGNN